MHSPASLGPYRIVELLGQGGMGAVYRAAHETTGAEVALKVVAAPSSAGIAAIRREVHALSRVQHRGVVRIVDQGVVESLPWYAMELVSGQSLRAIVEDPGASPKRTLELCVALCEPLAVVHAAGIVHRDLKPDNILVRDDGQPVLVDFGIAAGFGGAAGREVLAAAGEVLGTAAYMAPEQLRGDLVDARADLYALGCMLYECITGQTPFAEHHGYALLRAHLFDTPIAPSQRGAVASPELDALVLRLLAKRPADRIGYAADVAAMLSEMGHGAPKKAHIHKVHAAPYLYRAELAGRGEWMARAAALLDALAQEKRSAAIYAGGESGVGKTRLGVEITRQAALRELDVVTGQCLPAGREGSTPLHPFLAVLHEALARAPVASHARVLAPYLPELAPSFEHLPEPPPLAPDAARARVLDSASAVILALAAAKPLLLVLDDVQWADELSLALLDRLNAATRDAPGLVCACFYRAEEARDALLKLANAPGVEHWMLGRLDEKSVAEMAAGMLGTPRVPRAWAELLARVSAGNPFFAGEYLRAAVDAGILARDARGRWSLKAADAARGQALSLPSTIEALLEARFAQLGSAERRMLAAAAVVGRSLEVEVAAATADIDDRHALDAVSVLVQRQILEEAPGGELRFVHDRLWEAAYARLHADERRRLHGRAARAIEALHEGDPSQFERLANHHAGAAQHEAAYWYATIAAERAAAVHANEQAVTLHQAALAAAQAGNAADARLAESWTRLGDLVHQAGRADEAHDAYTRALTHVPQTAREHRATLHLACGKTWETRQHNAEALAAYAEAERCLGQAPSAGDDAAFWRTWIQIGIERIAIHYFSGDTEALTHVMAAIGPLVERRGTDAQRARFFQSLVQRDLRGARYRTSPETVAYARTSLAAFLAGPDRAMATDARFTLAAVLLWNDTLDDAEEEMLIALDEAEATGNAVLKVLCLCYLSVIARRRKDVESVRAYSLQCMTAAEAAKMARYVAVAEANLGWLHSVEGEADEAERQCKDALARWRDVSHAFPFEWLARLPLMKLAASSGRLDEATEHAHALVAPTQQRFPAALEASLSRADVFEALHAAEVHGFR